MSLKDSESDFRKKNKNVAVRKTVISVRGKVLSVPSMSWCNECVLNDCVSEPNLERVTASGLMVKNESNVVYVPLLKHLVPNL